MEKTNFLHVSTMLTSFLERLIAFFCSLRFEFWRTQIDVHPSITVEHNINNRSAAVEAASEREYILPCEQRLQRLEKVFEELNNKPDKMPVEKEQMLMESLDRIKSVEFDLEKTKRVFICTFCQSSTTFAYADCMVFKIVLLLQVLHAAVKQQLEISELLENMRKSKCRVSWFFKFPILLFLPFFFPGLMGATSS